MKTSHKSDVPARQSPSNEGGPFSRLLLIAATKMLSLALGGRRLPEDFEPWRAALITPRTSQKGEDSAFMTLMRRFKEPPPEFYVDIGANHPVHFSNTWRLSQMGWHGLCVEPNGALCELYEKLRPRDKVVSLLVGDNEGEATFVECKKSAHSYVETEGGYHQPENEIVSRRRLRITTLGSLLREQGIDGQGIGLLTVDCEGMDLRILKSNDWSLFRPWGVIAEERPGEEPLIERFMISLGYQFAGWTRLSKIFLLRDKLARRHLNKRALYFC